MRSKWEKCNAAHLPAAAVADCPSFLGWGSPAHILHRPRLVLFLLLLIQAGTLS